ncbi:hypothetical protein, partial [Gordonia aquimaris]
MPPLEIVRTATSWLTDTMKDALQLSDVRIDGIEVTQSIQYYKTELKPTVPDNSVELMAYKAAYVRVYLRSRFADQIENVWPTLSLYRWVNRPVFE